MKLNNFLVIVFSAFLLFSCSDKKDDPIKTNPIVITAIETSKQFAFTEDTIVLNIDATGYTSIEVISNDDKITLTKINETTYNLQATEAIDATILVNLLADDDFTTSANIDISFYEHGVIDYKVVEGLTVDEDSAEKAIELLGEPDFKGIDTENNAEFWYYFDKGFWIEIDTSLNQVHIFRLYGGEWTRTFDDIAYTGKGYPYEIGNSLKIIDYQLTMDVVIDTFGEPTEKVDAASSSTSNRKYYKYEELQTLFYFFSDDIDDTTSKVVPYINVY